MLRLILGKWFLTMLVMVEMETQLQFYHLQHHHYLLTMVRFQHFPSGVLPIVGYLRA